MKTPQTGSNAPLRADQPRWFAARPAFMTALVCAALFAGTILLFSRVVGYGFLNYDDPGYVTENLHVQGGLQWSGIEWAFTGLADYWHPLSWMSHMLDWEMFGANAAGHHATSVAWHAVNAVLVFLVFRRLGVAFWLSAFGAAVFAWHPLRVESVAWITERKDVMSGFFFLLTVLAYLGYGVRRRDGRPAAWCYAAALAAFACGLMSKPMLVSVPVVLLLLDFWPMRRAELPGSGRAWGGLLIEKLPFFALSTVVSVITVQMQAVKGSFVLDVPFGARLGNAVVSIARYLGKFFRPADLVVCYPHPGEWPVIAVAGAAVLVAAITLVAWFRRRQEPWLLAGWLWMLVMLAPVIGLVQAGFQAMADRYTYLPLLGWEIVCLCLIERLQINRRLRALAASSGVIVLALLAMVTWKQESFWKDSITLFRHALAADDMNPVAQGFLGYTLASEGRMEEAEMHSRKAVELDPHDSPALIVLARISLQSGDPEGAISLYEKALEGNPDNGAVHLELGQLLLSRGRIDEAASHIRKSVASNPDLGKQCLAAGAAELDAGRFDRAWVQFQTACVVSPDDSLPHFWSGFALARLGRGNDALLELKKAVELKPDYAGSHVEIGMLLLARDQPADALGQFHAALTIDKTLGVAHLGAARALLRVGRTAEAMTSFESAAKYSPDDAEVQKAWAEALARNREFEKAAEHYARAVQLAPRDAAAHAGYGYILAFMNRNPEAIHEWEEALRLNPDFPGLRGRLEALRIASGL